jgi:hypothetical protein
MTMMVVGDRVGRHAKAVDGLLILHKMFEFRVSAIPGYLKLKHLVQYQQTVNCFRTPSHSVSNHHRPPYVSSISFVVGSIEYKLSYGVQRKPRRVSKDTKV